LATATLAAELPGPVRSSLPGAPLASHWEIPPGDPALASGFTTLLHDPRGLIYLAGPGGVVELDGREWRNFPLPGGQPVRSLALDQGGRLWVAGTRFIGYLAPASGERLALLPLEQTDPSPGEGILAILPSADGAVTFVRPNGLERWRAGHTAKIPSPEPWTAAGSHPGGGVLVSPTALSLIVGDRLDAIAPLPAELSRATGVATLSHGRIVVIETDRLWSWDRADGWARFGPVDRFPSAISAWAALRDGGLSLGFVDGRLAVLEADGLVRQQVEPLGDRHNAAIRALAEDPEGGLWALHEDGLERLEIHMPITRWDDAAGLHGAVTSVLPAPSAVYVATSRGVFRFRSEANAGADRFEPVGTALGACSDLAALGVDLIAACATGTWLLRNGETQLLGQAATVLIADPDRPGALWLGSPDGLARASRDEAGAWRLETLEQPNVQVRALAAAPDGTLLAAGAEGIMALDPSQRREPRLLEDLRPDFAIQLFSTRRHGVLANGLQGLFRLDPATFHFDRLLLRPGLESQWIGPLVEDPEGTLWFVAREGLYRLSEGHTPTLHLPASGRFDPAGVTTLVPAGRTLWIGSTRGLLRLWTVTALSPRVAPRVLLRRVEDLPRRRTVSEGVFADRAGRVGSSQVDKAVLGPGPVSLRFEVASPRWDSRNELRYRFRLVGSRDPGWSAWGSEAAKESLGLTAGHYRFEAQARDAAGLESEPVTWAFAVLPRWFETWWAKLGAFVAGVLGLAATIVGTARWARTRAFEEAQAERRRRELADARALHQSMIPMTPPVIEGLDLAVEHRTASEVGGDYWDIFPQSDGKIFLAIGDATGHGLAAGLMVAATRTALLTVDAPDLPSVLRRLDRVLRRVAADRRHHMALSLIELAPTARGWRVELAGAGIPPGFILRHDGAIEELSCPGLPLGSGMPRPHRSVSTELRRDDLLLLFTDGLFERFDRAGEQLGWHGLTALLHDIAQRLRLARPRLDAHTLLALILGEWEAKFTGTGLGWSGAGDEDDVTVVMVRCTRHEEGAS
jgi:streptogramin lyase